MLNVLRSGLAVHVFSPSGRDLAFDPRSGNIVALGTGLGAQPSNTLQVNTSLIYVQLHPRSGL